MQHCEHTGEFIRCFIGRINEHDAAPLHRRQSSFHRCFGIKHGDRRAPVTTMANCKRGMILRMKLVERQPVLGAQHLARDFRRAGIAQQLPVRIDGADGGKPRCQQRRNTVTGNGPCEKVLKPPNPRLPFPRLSRFLSIQGIGANTGMGIEQQEALVLLLQVLDEAGQHDVLQHIAMIAGVKCVAVVHGRGTCQTRARKAIIAWCRPLWGAMQRTPSFAILVAISAIGPLALNLFVPSIPGLQREFAISYGTAQLTLTLYLIGTAVCQLGYGPLSDRFGRRPLLLIGLALFVVASIFAALAQSIEWLIAARLVQAVGGAAGIVLGRAMVRDVFDREKSASVIAYITMAFVMAPMVAPAIGGWLDHASGWRAGFWLLAVLGSAVLAVAFKLLPETHVNRGGASRGASLLEGGARLFSIPRFRHYTLTLALTSCVFFAFLGGAPHVMVDILHREPLDYGLWFIMVSGGYMAGNFFSGRFTQKLGLDRMILWGCVITAVGGLACLVCALTGLLSPFTMFGAMSIAALGNGLTIPNGTAGAISVDQRLTGAAAGWSGFIQMASGAAASQLVGSLQDGWPAAIFWFMFAASALALAVQWLSVSGRRQQGATAQSGDRQA